MADLDTLTDHQRELIEKVKGGDAEPDKPVELVALQNLERLGYLTSEHSDDGFTFSVVKQSKPRKSKSGDDDEG